jgi:hypothetical protein
MASFDQLPSTVELLMQKVDNLTKIVEGLAKTEPQPEPDELRFINHKKQNYDLSTMQYQFIDVKYQRSRD